MATSLLISIRQLDSQGTFHGRRDGGEPEWPPSPLRVFQALVNAAASRWREPQFVGNAKPALEWFQQLAPPEVIAPDHHVGTPFRIAVPNNDLDVWAGPVSKGNEPKKQPNELKAMKQVRPTHLSGEAVHYLYPLVDELTEQVKGWVATLEAAARSITHLGWGIDMVAADARVISQAEADKLPGHRWRVVPSGGVSLRVPKAGTLQNLIDKHTAFLGRLSADGFKPVPPLHCFDVKQYHSPTAGVGKLPARPVAAFELRTPDFARFQPYDPCRRTRDVAGMVRNAVADLAARMRPFGWTDADINTFVHGHTPDGSDRARGAGADRRFAFLPLPSVLRYDGGSKVGPIRRVLIVAPPECREAVTWARVLGGQELTPEPGTCPAVLRLIDRPASALASDPNLGPYLGEAREWSTVTPVVLHRHDLDDSEELRRRLGDAFRHAGVPDDLLAESVVEWGRFGYRAGVEPATRYLPARNLTGPRYHVRVRFRQAVAGPLAVGAGRYRGFGLFVKDG